MNTKRVSIVISCYKRPARTRRMISCISTQTINNFEAFIIGDGCNDFQELLSEPTYQDWILHMKAAGNDVISFNMDKNYSGCGYHIINHAIQNATGEYFMFAANDDVILDNHLEHYLSEIENTQYDMVCYPTLVRPHGDAIRVPQLIAGCIGHSEIIVKTSLAKSLPLHGPNYGHDWDFIDSVIKSGANIKISENLNVTYHVMSVGPEKTRVDLNID